jgi:preprotein translocase subunit YajC
LLALSLRARTYKRRAPSRRKSTRRDARQQGRKGDASAIAFGFAAAIVRQNLGPGADVRAQRRKLDMNFISPAFAQTAVGAPGAADIVMQLAPFGIILIIMYFLILRPQQQRAKAHQDMVSNIRRGDTVVTNGGLIGKVTKTIDDSEIEIEVAPNVRVRQSRGAINEVRAKGEPVKDSA